MTDLKIDSANLTTGAASPYLPGTNIQYAWDSTSIGMLKTCPRLYQYTMIDGWGSRDESVHLRFGIEYHSALQDYAIARSQGTAHEDAIRITVQNLLQRIHGWAPDTSTRAGKYKNPRSILSLVVDYLDHFGTDDPAETIILDNGAPAVELSFRFELDFGPEAGIKTEYITTDEAYEINLSPGAINMIDPATGNKVVPTTTRQPYLLSGHLDRAVDFNGFAFVMDRKTSVSTLGTYYFDQYAPNNQMSLYSLAGKIVLDAPIKGVIIDAAQVLLEKPNSFQRGFTYRTDDQLDEWLVDLRQWLESAERYATIGYWPQNDTACDKFGGCRFREVCSKSPSVRETYLKSKFDKLEEHEKWNPLRSR